MFSRQDWNPSAQQYSPAIVLGAGAAPQSWTGDTNLQPLASVLIPAGCMGGNGSLRISAMWTTTNNVNSKSLIGKMGASTIRSFGLTSNLTYVEQYRLCNRGNPKSQVCIPAGLGNGGFGGNAGALGTFAIDTTLDQYFTFQTQLAVGTDTVTLEAWLIELLVN